MEFPERKKNNDIRGTVVAELCRRSPPKGFGHRGFGGIQFKVVVCFQDLSGSISSEFKFGAVNH